MVVGFRRTISFPAPRTSPPPSGSGAGGAAAGATARAADKSAAYRARSASLPCRFHPLVLQLDDDVADLRAAVARLALPTSGATATASAEAVAEAASRLGAVLVSLSELLHHPQAQDPLRRLAASPLAERLLDDFLRLADAHGSFRDALVALAALQAEARAALRREEPARLASASRALRRWSTRDLVPRVASSARAVAAKPPPPPPADLPADAAAIAAAVVDAAAAVASASAAVFSGVSALSVAAATARVEVVDAATPCWMASPARFGAPSATPRHHHVVVTTRPSSACSSMPRIWWVADLMRWMSRAKRRSAKRQHAADGHSGSASAVAGSAQVEAAAAAAAAVDPEELERKAAFERLDSLGRCIADVESSGEKVFRALVNTRVSLLNILSPAF